MGDWGWQKLVVFSVPFLLVVVGLLVWGLSRRTIRTRIRLSKQLRDDPDINEWLVVFSWSRKILYGPTIAYSILAAILSWTGVGDPKTIGGIWLSIFFINFLVDEYELSIKVLLIGLLCFVAMMLWLVYLQWVEDFFRFFRKLGIQMDGLGYLLIALIFLVAIIVSWIRGLFYYVAFTPNYLNIQIGPTETGEQIAREEYSTRVDTGDFLERLQGFGRIVITFADHRRQPMVMLVGRIGSSARRLESIRGKLALDRHQPHREGPDNV